MATINNIITKQNLTQIPTGVQSRTTASQTDTQSSSKRVTLNIDMMSVVFGFMPHTEVAYRARPVCKSWQFAFSDIRDFTDPYITDEQLRKTIHETPPISSLNLSNCRYITDWSLECLARSKKLTNLTELNLKRSGEITDAGLRYVAELTKVRKLNLMWCVDITDVGLKEVATMTNLTMLNLAECNKITDAGLKKIATMRNLTMLNLKGATSRQITAVGIEHLTQLPMLIKLDLSGCPITGEDLREEAVAKWSKLQTLNLKACEEITDAGLKRIARLQNLTTLNLTGCYQITDRGFKWIARLQNLTTLNLTGCTYLTDEGLKWIATLQNLTTLHLKGCHRITDEGLKWIATLQNLTTLNLTNCTHITDEGLKWIATLQNLTTLNLTGCYQITVGGLKHLAKLPNLTKLRLTSCTKITKADLERHLTYSRGKHYLTSSRGKHELQKMKSIFNEYNLLYPILHDLIRDYWLPPPIAVIEPTCHPRRAHPTDKDYVLYYSTFDLPGAPKAPNTQ